MKHSNKKYRLVTLSAAMVLATALICNLSASAAPTTIPANLPISRAYQHGTGKSVGTIEAAQPQAYIMHADRKNGYVAQKGLPVYNGDTLFTRKGGKLTVAIEDGSQTVLAPNSSLVLDKSVYDPNGGNRLLFMKMLTGKARFLIKKMVEYKYSRASVGTRSSVVGVRGSDFIIEISQDGDTTVITALNNTVLEIFNPDNPLQNPVTITSFQQLITVLGQVFGSPADVPREEIMKMIQELGLIGDGGGNGDDNGPPAGGGNNNGQGSPDDYVPDDSPPPEDPVFYPGGDPGQPPPPPLPPLPPDPVPLDDNLTGDSDTIFQQTPVLPDMPGPPQ